MLRGVIRGALIGASRSGGISNFTSDDVIAIIFIFFIAFVVYYFYKKHASLQQKRQTLMNLENNTPMLGFSWRTDPNTVWKGVHQLALTDAKIASGILSCCGPYYLYRGIAHRAHYSFYFKKSVLNAMHVNMIDETGGKFQKTLNVLSTKFGQPWEERPRMALWVNTYTMIILFYGASSCVFIDYLDITGMEEQEWAQLFTIRMQAVSILDIQMKEKLFQGAA